MVASPNKAKVTVSLEISAEVEVSDDGYLGTGETVAKHIQRAKDDTRNYVVLIQRGGLEPQQVRARFNVTAVTIVPEAM